MKLINLFLRYFLEKNIHFWNKEILLCFINSIYRRTIRRLSVKKDSWQVVQALGEELRPVQWGMQSSSTFGPTLCISGIVATRVLLEIDMNNTFNSLRSDSFLSVARVSTPGLYSLLWQAHSFHTRSFFSKEFASETGIQQRAPIGPAFLALSVDEAARGV